MDLGSGETLILAIVPFEQIAIDFGHGPKPRQLASPCRAPHWARKHLFEIESSQSFSERAGVMFAALCQQKVCEPRMLTRAARLSLSLPGQVNNRKSLAH